MNILRWVRYQTLQLWEWESCQWQQVSAKQKGPVPGTPRGSQEQKSRYEREPTTNLSETFSLQISISLLCVYKFWWIRTVLRLVQVNYTHLASSQPPSKHLPTKAPSCWSDISETQSVWTCDPLIWTHFNQKLNPYVNQARKGSRVCEEGGVGVKQKRRPIVPQSRQEQPEDTSFTLITLHALPIASSCTQ